MAHIKRGMIVLALTVFLGVAVSAFFSVTRVKPAMAEITGLPTIIIDAGHGGMDGGAVAGDFVEKDINLAISLVLRDIFIANGFQVLMTRDIDISIHDEGITSTRKQKTSDLHNRLAIANSHPNAVFLSIHQNKFESGKAKGAQVFYSPNNPQSRELAELLQQDFISMLQPDNTRLCKKAGKNLYLMYKATCPSVLVECGFMSNSEEVSKLVDSEYQAQVAFTIFCSVMRFMGLDYAV